jgi:hypothetical protein
MTARMRSRPAWRLAATLFLFLGSRAHATLSAHLDVFPLGAGMGQLVTVVMQISNSDAVAVTALTPTVGVATGSALPVSGPSPAFMDLSGSSSGNFTYSYSITGCGGLSFTGSASGTESGGAQTSNTDSTLLMSVPCPGTPTVTPTPSATATPGPVLVSPTSVPGTADAKVLGSRFHPDQGESVNFLATLPFGGPLSISIYSRQGKKLKTIQLQGIPGDNSASWDGRSDLGDMVATGIYAVYFQGNGLNKVSKVVVIK